MTKWEELLLLLKEVAYYGHTLSLFDADRETMLPNNAGPGRDEIKAFMAGKAAEMFTRPEIGEVLAQLASVTDLDPGRANLVRMIERGYTRAKAVPLHLVSALAKATSQAHRDWTQAKDRANFDVFLPSLRQVLNLAKERASALGSGHHPYDDLAPDFEPGITAEETKRVLFPLRQPLTDLVRRIAEAKPVDESCIQGFFAPDRQEIFSRLILARMGFDFGSGRLIAVPGHPMTITVGPNDIRLTTKIKPNDIKICLFGTMHEGGHGLYCQGAASDFDWLWFDIGGLAYSMATHESQSRFWENVVGRSMAFWEYFFPFLKAIMPEFQEVPLDAFWKAINASKPSLIRTEADEVTYGLHILLRFELELALLSGELDPADLPAAWNAKMKEYLGITPENDAVGCLQDVHWSVGYIGYFPSYLLGNLMTAMIRERMETDMSLTAEIGSGKLLAVKAWLKDHIHDWGMAYEMPALVRSLTGEDLNPGPYLAYLEEKYSQVYNL
ncbi:MAG: carboxypeptidase M32 [bacterium]|nr:carboxypeptidase M32 [bacterium]